MICYGAMVIANRSEFLFNLFIAFTPS